MNKLILGLLAMAAFSAGVAASEGVVTASLLNARLEPSVKSPVMLKLKNGEKVEILSAAENNWLELAVPERAPVYVSEAHVVGGVASANIRMRAGKGAEFACWGVLKKGEKVTLLGDRAFGWVRIAPPERLRIYVVGLFVDGEVPSAVDKSVASPGGDVPVKPEEASPSAAPEMKLKNDVEQEKNSASGAAVSEGAEEKKTVAPAAETVPVAEKVPATESQPKAELKTPAADPVKPDAVLTALGIAADSIGREVKLTGTLVAVGSSKSPATNYALMGEKSNQGFVYDAGNTGELKKLEGARATVTGIAFQVPGWHAPVVVMQLAEKAR